MNSTPSLSSSPHTTYCTDAFSQIIWAGLNKGRDKEYNKYNQKVDLTVGPTKENTWGTHHTSCLTTLPMGKGGSLILLLTLLSLQHRSINSCSYSRIGDYRLRRCMTKWASWQCTIAAIHLLFDTDFRSLERWKLQGFPFSNFYSVPPPPG